MKNFIAGLWAVVFVFSLVACGGGGSSGGGGGSVTGTGTLISATGASVSSIEASIPVASSWTGLSANTRYQIDLVDPDGDEVCTNDVYTDASGNVPQSQYCFLRDQQYTANGRVDAMVVDAKSLPVTSFMLPMKAVSTGDYALRVRDSSDSSAGSLTVPVTTSATTVCASNSSGGCARSFLKTSSNVYATIESGTGISDGDVVDIYVVSNKCNIGYTAGDVLSDISGGADTATVSYSSGVFTTSTPVWATPASTGTYDIVVDADQSGTYSSGDVVEILDYAGMGGLCAPGFTVQDAYSADTGVVMQIAMNANRAYQDVFSNVSTDPNYSDIYAEVQSTQRLAQSFGVRKYIVAHQDAWVGGETLTDVISPTIDSVQVGCTNQQRRLIGPIGLLSAGCYDVVFDVDADGVYDLGGDAVDNIDLNSSTTCGFRVVGSSSTLSVSITSITDADDESVAGGTSVANSSTVTIAGSVSGISSDDGATVYAYVIKGTQQSSLVSDDLTENGTFSLANLPLFSGANTVIIYVTEGTGTSMVIAQTTSTVTWNPGGVSGDIDISAHITWTQLTDMDTHFVKPSGTFAGDGDSSNYSDCHWNNECKIETSGNYGLDWSVTAGQAASDISDVYVAKLDRDCIGCDDKYENVWINSADQVSPDNGRYLLCVYAFRGTDTPSAVVSINGIAVANLTVPVAINDADSSANTWFVGYIDWAGSGAGSWITVNSVGDTTICH